MCHRGIPPPPVYGGTSGFDTTIECSTAQQQPPLCIDCTRRCATVTHFLSNDTAYRVGGHETKRSHSPSPLWPIQLHNGARRRCSLSNRLSFLTASPLAKYILLHPRIVSTHPSTHALVAALCSLRSVSNTKLWGWPLGRRNQI